MNITFIFTRYKSTKTDLFFAKRQFNPRKLWSSPIGIGPISMSSWPTDLLCFTDENHNNYLCIIPSVSWISPDIQILAPYARPCDHTNSQNASADLVTFPTRLSIKTFHWGRREGCSGNRSVGHELIEIGPTPIGEDHNSMFAHVPQTYCAEK